MDKRTRMQRLHDEVADRIAGMEDLFLVPDDYRLTFIARHVRNPEAHIIVSSEEPGVRGERVREALAALEVNGVGSAMPSVRTSTPRSQRIPTLPASMRLRTLLDPTEPSGPVGLGPMTLN